MLPVRSRRTGTLTHRRPVWTYFGATYSLYVAGRTRGGHSRAGSRRIHPANLGPADVPAMLLGPSVDGEVTLEELDQIIDAGMRAPLSESDGEKLKAVLHILAERAKPRWRTTEKTRSVL